MIKLGNNLKVRKLNVNDYQKWDELIEISPQGTIFHSSDYLTICDAFLDGKLSIFGCFQGDACKQSTLPPRLELVYPGAPMEDIYR